MTPCLEETFDFLGAGKTGETGCIVYFKKRFMIKEIRLPVKKNYGNKQQITK